MVRPTTLAPSCASSPATAELSTPPLMATAMRSRSGMRTSNGRYAPQMLHRFGNRFDQVFHLPGGVQAAQREAERAARAIGREADRQQHMRRLDGAARTGGAARDR